MKVISHEKIIGAKISPSRCFEWVSDAIRRKKEAVLPPKTSIKPGSRLFAGNSSNTISGVNKKPDTTHMVYRGGVFYNVMPTVVPWVGRAGVKVVNRYPGRTPALDSQILLYDTETGGLMAIMDGNWITAMRTGACAAHSMELFAKTDFETIGIVGLGNIARATMDVFLSLYPNRRLRLKLKKYKDQHKLFADRYRDRTDLTFEFLDDYEQVVSGSDIILEAATYLDDDICGFDSIGDGALVVPVHTRGFSSFDYRFDKIFCDDIGHVSQFKNFGKYRNIAEVSDVVNHIQPGRENDKEKIIAYNIGIALLDICFADKLYGMLSEDCPEISLNPPIEKFWV